MSDARTPDPIVPREQWVWFGFPGHFIAADSCRFRMATQVGRYLISTVGAYFPYKSGEMEEIGYGRKFETFVFEAGDKCRVKDCGCGMPQIDGSEIDSEPANDAGTAQANHIEMCLKYARLV